MSELTLGNILSGEPEAVEEVVETVEEPTGEVETAETTEEVVEEVKTEDTPPVSEISVDDLKGQVKAFQAKADDEKSKRQALQQQIKAYQEQRQTQESPDPYAEPDKAIDYAVSQVEQRFQNKLLNMSELGASQRHSDDFAEMKEIFFDKLAAENPALNAEALSQVDPYEFIYRTAKNHTELAQLSEVGGVEAYKAKIEQEVRAKFEAEYAEKSKQEIEQKITASIPGSLSTQRAAGANKAKVFAGQMPLNKIIGR